MVAQTQIWNGVPITGVVGFQVGHGRYRDPSGREATGQRAQRAEGEEGEDLQRVELRKEWGSAVTRSAVDGSRTADADGDGR